MKHGSIVGARRISAQAESCAASNINAAQGTPRHVPYNPTAPDCSPEERSEFECILRSARMWRHGSHQQTAQHAGHDHTPQHGFFTLTVLLSNTYSSLFVRTKSHVVS